MAKDVYDINIAFLKSKGIELRSTGLMFTPFTFENEKLEISTSEYGTICIINKETNVNNVINFCDKLLNDEDIFI